MIHEKLRESLIAKEGVDRKLNAKWMRHFFNLCFEHYLKHLGRPFNLLEALLATKQLPDTLPGYFLELMRHSIRAITAEQRSRSPEEVALRLLNMVTPTICSMVALDLDLNYSTRIENIKDLYRGKSTPKEGKSTASYESAVRKALEEFLETSVECSFSKDGVKCINSKMAHGNIPHHKGSDASSSHQGRFLTVSPRRWRKTATFTLKMSSRLYYPGRSPSTVSLFGGLTKRTSPIFIASRAGRRCTFHGAYGACAIPLVSICPAATQYATHVSSSKGSPLRRIRECLESALVLSTQRCSNSSHQWRF